MKSNPLTKLIKRLVEIEPSDSPLISCFVSLNEPRADYFREIETQAAFVGKRLSGRKRTEYEDALAEIRERLEAGPKAGSRSIAIYSRWGDDPVLVATEFPVPLQTQFIVDDLPHIYPLIELKDTYRRFVIALTTEDQARILETTVGSVTEEILAKRRDLRERVGREWTREHYHNHKRERTSQFVKEKVRIIERLMIQRGINYLVLAGSPRMTRRLHKALPPRVREKVVGNLNAKSPNDIDPILMESILHIAAAENVESHDRVLELETAILKGGLGVAGISASMDALRDGYADVLVIDQDLEDDEIREELVRLAIKAGVEIETVGGSETLKRFSGVGCLLRFLPFRGGLKTRLTAA